MIPKIIHLCWFGNNSYPPIVEQCINSWKKVLPNFKIMVWNENSFDIDKYPFCKTAYENKKWAFVCDYARLVVLKQYGGIYMDTDLEVIKDFSPLLINEDYISCIFEGGLITCGFIACSKNNPFIEKVLEYYSKHMIREDGGINYIMNPLIFTKIAIDNYNYSLKMKHFYKDGFKLFPMEFFMPYRKNLFGKDRYAHCKYVLTKNTYTIHHDLGSWGKANPFSKFIKSLMRLVLPKSFYLYSKRKHNVKVISSIE